MKTNTKLVGGKRRVTITLSEKKAKALADAIDNNITWADTKVEAELAELHDALYAGEL